MNIALILSGGKGIRLGGSLPKQYIEVDGKPVIAYCLQIFEKHPAIDAIQIVADKDWQHFIEKWTGGKCRGFSLPGENRQLSVLSGLSDILKYADQSDTVIIHDAARPLVTEELISSCLNACRTYDGAMPILPAKDTMYIHDGEKIVSLLDRKRVCAGQSPEAFIFGKYYKAVTRLLPEAILKINGSSEPAFLAGMNIAVVAGDEDNFKITTSNDLERFVRKIEQQKL